MTEQTIEELKAEIERLKPLADALKQKEVKQQSALIERQNSGLTWWTDINGKMKKVVESKGIAHTVTYDDCVKFTDGTVVRWTPKGYRKV